MTSYQIYFSKFLKKNENSLHSFFILFFSTKRRKRLLSLSICANESSTNIENAEISSVASQNISAMYCGTQVTFTIKMRNVHVANVT